MAQIKPGKRRLKTMKDYLYRYQPLFRSENHAIQENIEIFSKKELFAPLPTKFNDPFDCKAFITHKGCNIEDLFNFSCDRHRQYLTTNGELGKSEEEIQTESFNMLCNVLYDELFTGTSDLSKALDEQYEKYLRDIEGNRQSDLPGIGIISLSAKNDDILMWGHYADGHKGYCIEFDRQSLVEWIKTIPGKLSEVIYSKAYPTIADYLKYKEQNNFDELFLLTKSSHWSYEEELRILVGIDWKKERPHIFPIPENIIAGVIFGCEIPDENRKKSRIVWIGGSKSLDCIKRLRAKANMQ